MQELLNIISLLRWSLLHTDAAELMMMIGLVSPPKFSLIIQEKVAFGSAPINGQ